MSTLRAFLEQRTTPITPHNQYGLVFQHGREFEPRRLPKPYTMGEQNDCFANSFKMMLRHDFIYCEGYMLPSSDFPLPMLHAWCVDRDGNVLDRTVSAGEYFGIPFKRAFVERIVMKYEMYGIINNWEAGYPMRNADPADFLFTDFEEG